MSKTPPNRRGITFEVGAQLEARDSLKNWYAANIEKIDYDDEKVLIHYRQWSHRYDEWFDWTSPYLRPVERIQLRRQGLQDDAVAPGGAPLHGFHVNDKVLASWSDCRFYPAKVVSVNKDGTYTVKFYDGVIQTVKEMHVKPFIKAKGGGGRCRASDRNVVRRVQTRRDRKPQENGGPKAKRARRSTSDQEESNSEDEEQEEGAVTAKSKQTNGEPEAAGGVKQEAPYEGARSRDAEKETGLSNGVAAEESEGARRVNGDVEKEEFEAEQTGAKPYPESSTPSAETDARSAPQAELVPVTTATTGPRTAPGDQSGSVEAAPSPPVKPVRKQGFHNPNRFSREPLYRVIKNQPPLVLSVNLDHNPFKCGAPGCSKSFRKAKLLHYHMKYYHGEEPPPEEEHSPTRSVQTRVSDKQAAAGARGADGSKRRRTVSASMHVGVAAAGRRTSAPPAVGSQQRALLRDKSKENHLDRNGSGPLQDPDRAGFDGGCGRDKPKQKDFLRIKLKKKKKKSKSDEDSATDWSTDSCGWSDEDFDVDLDVTTPPLSVDSGAVDTSDQERVRCVCEVEEENDFMIQCEDCLCWQHGTCMGLLEDNVPDRYTCHVCRDPPGLRQSLRYWYDRDWLSSGHMHGLSFLEENYSHQNAKKIATTHQLLGDVHRLLEVLSGLQLKMAVLQSPAHSDLHLWRQPWKPPERPPPGRGGAPEEDLSRGEILMSNALERLGRAAAGAAPSCPAAPAPFPSFQDSYITNDHCYQKPRAYYPAVEQRLVVETRQGSELEDSLRSSEELLEREQRYGSLLDLDRPRRPAAKASADVSWSPAESKEESGRGGGEPADNRQQQWQVNLLDHMDAVQDQVSHRMDFIERELDVLESWLDYTGELEPPEPLARLPQLKLRIKRLLSQLSKVQQIALYSST